MTETSTIFQEDNKCSIFQLAYLSRMSVEDYKTFLVDKMRERADVLFDKVKVAIDSPELVHFKSSMKELKIVDINGEENSSGLNIIFSQNGKEYILVYNLWDMVNYMEDEYDAITLMVGISETNKSIDDSIADAVSTYMEIRDNDVHQKIANADPHTNDSCSILISILKEIERLYN